MHNQKSQKERFNSRTKSISKRKSSGGRDRKSSLKPKAPKKLCTDFAVAYIEALLKDAHQIIPPYRKADLAKDLNSLRTRARHNGPAFFLTTMPGLIDGFFKAIEGAPAIYPNFRSRGGYPVFMGRLFHIAHGKTRHDKYVTDSINIIYSVSVAFKKLRGTYRKEKLAEQYRDFVKVDGELPDLDITNRILQTAEKYCATFIKDIDVDEDTECVPRPGPGATNQPIEKNLRYEPKVLFQTVDKVLPYDAWFYPHMWDVVEQSRDYLNLSKLEEPSSRFKFVPKTAGKARGICIEHNEVQFLQQAVARLLRAHIDKKLKNNLALNDQSVNGCAAVSSSLTRAFATIDMSEASDRISRDLVQYLFQSNARLCEVLLGLSTRVIEPPKEADTKDLLRAKKFAPMGSALCFPVMSLVHYFLVKAIILHTGRATSLQDSNSILVYGDDILLPTQYTEDVYALLPQFGMKLNTTKSFYKSFFRESCGKHAYLGRDITPVYVKHTPNHTSFEALASCLAVERDLFEKGFRKAAQLFRVCLTQVYPWLSEVKASTCCVGFIRQRPSTGQLSQKVRWNADLHRWEIRTQVLERLCENTVISKASSALLRWYGNAKRRSGTWVQALFGESNFSMSLTNLGRNLRMDSATEVPVPISELRVRTRWVPWWDVNPT